MNSTRSAVRTAAFIAVLLSVSALYFFGPNDGDKVVLNSPIMPILPTGLHMPTYDDAGERMFQWIVEIEPNGELSQAWRQFCEDLQKGKRR